MATGIARHEQLGDDALTAALPHRDPHPLPDAHAQPALTYTGRLSKSEVLSPLPVTFVDIAPNGLVAPAVPSPNGLILSDNLFALHGLIAAGRKATLIYLDPPYNTGMNFQSRHLEHAYNDQREEAAYIEFMRRRLILMRELLSNDGSIYLHIGHKMLSHLKLVMDEIFGSHNFRNLITRRKCSSKNFTKHQFANLNDYILFYTKSDAYKWNQPGVKPEQEWIEKEYPKTDVRGRYKLVPIHAPGTRRGETGKPWRDMMPPPGKHWQFTPEKLDEFDRLGQMHWSRNGNPRRKVYLTNDKLVPFTDYWEGFRDAHHQSIAVTGYPTEKNLAMLRMIVAASSEPGDLVIDPFCGSGTTLHAAEDLKRQWVGIDQSFGAMKASIQRFRYGVEPMGDFVSRHAAADFDADNVVDLFSVAAAAEGSVAKQAPSSRTAAPFNFLVDQELLETLGGEVMALASL